MSFQGNGCAAACVRALGPLFVAATLAFAPITAEAGCKYKRIGSIAYEWVGQRLAIDGSVNDQPTRMVVDTGAVWTTASAGLAKRLDLPLKHVYSEEWGFGGRSTISMSRLDELSLGRFQWHGAKIAVAWDAPGMDDMLVGANSLFESDVELDGHDIVFFKPDACDDAELGYWADDVPWVPFGAAHNDDLRVNVVVQLNGHPVWALVDSGSPSSAIDVSIARELGFDPGDPATQIGKTTGIGKHAMAASVMTLDTLVIGPEIIHHPRVIVMDMFGGLRQDVQTQARESQLGAESRMVLGADFVRSHRLLFANSQRRLYFSYVGGAAILAPAPGRPASAAPAGP